jgi:hypothetical protein
LLQVEAHLTRVYQSGLNTGEVATAVVHVAPSWRFDRDQVEDGRVDATGHVGSCYHYLSIFYILCHMCIIVFQSFACAYK